MITLQIDMDITYVQAVQALGALRQEIRAANCVITDLQPHEGDRLRARLRRLHTLVPVAEALVAGTNAQPGLFASPLASVLADPHAGELPAANP